MILLLLLICGCTAELRTHNIINYGKYQVDYNYTIGQANYAIYQPRADRYKGNCYRKLVPGINYTVSDYNSMAEQLGIDRGHLAPYADIGDISCNMNNIVPQNSNFNQGKWKENEIMLRNNYPNHWIVVGCKYTGATFTYRRKIFYDLVGCYYVVFNKYPLDRDIEIVRNGYVGYVGNSLQLPWWVVKNNPAIPVVPINHTNPATPAVPINHTNHTNPADHTIQITYIWAIVLFSAAAVMLGIAVIIIVMPDPKSVKKMDVMDIEL